MHTSDPRREDAPELIDRLMAPFRQFAGAASASGVVLIAATIIALAWSNSPWAFGYHALWDSSLGVAIGPWNVRSTLHRIINDGLMAVFFLLVGLEIKREILAGELASLRTAALPMFGAFGGMVVPAALYFMVTRGGPAAGGWGVPMATDIAFALGVLALLGDRVPVGLKVFLAALAIVDDIGAILVIALFYAGGIAWGPLAAAAAILAISAGANRAGVRAPWAYAVIGIALWTAVLASGVHASIAGVLLAMTIPMRTGIHEAKRVRDAEAVAVGLRIERSLHGIVAFGIMPLFALANAGVSLSGVPIAHVVRQPATIGVMLGLLVGKPVGIIAFAWIAARLGLASLPARVSWPMLGSVAVLGGIGFTMALFIGGLAFPDAGTLDAAKVGILVASTVAGLAGWLLLRRTTETRGDSS